MKKIITLLFIASNFISIFAQNNKIIFHIQDKPSARTKFYDANGNLAAELPENFVSTYDQFDVKLRDCYKAIENKSNEYEARAYVEAAYMKYDFYIVGENGTIVKNLGKKYAKILRLINGFFIAHRAIEGRKDAFMISYLDKLGNNAFGNREFWEAEPFSEGLAFVQEVEGGEWSFINEKGEKVINVDQFNSNPVLVADVEPFINGLSKIKLVNFDKKSEQATFLKYIYINKKGEIVEKEDKVKGLVPFSGGYYLKYSGEGKSFNGYYNSIEIFSPNQVLLYTFTNCFDLTNEDFVMKPYVVIKNQENKTIIIGLHQGKTYEIKLKEGLQNIQNAYFVNDLIVVNHSNVLTSDNCFGAKNYYSVFNFQTDKLVWSSKLDKSTNYYYNCDDMPSNLDFDLKSVGNLTISNLDLKKGKLPVFPNLKKLQITFQNPNDKKTDENQDGFPLILQDDLFSGMDNLEELEITMKNTSTVIYNDEEQNIMHETFALPSSLSQAKRLKKIYTEDAKFINLPEIIPQLPLLEHVEIKIPEYFYKYESELKESMKNNKKIKLEIYRN